MSIIDRIKIMFQGNQQLNPAEKLKQEVITPTQNDEITEEEAKEKIVELCKKYPELRKKVGEVLDNLDKEEVPAAPFAKAAVEISKTKEIPDKVAVDILTNLPDREVVKALKSAKLSDTDKVQVIDTLASDKLKEEQICNELNNLYKDCAGMNPLEIERRINKIIGIYKRTDNLNQVIYKIISKNLANSYYKFNGGMKVGPLERIIPAVEMLRVEIPNQIGEEYSKLLLEDEENKYDKEMVKRVLLDDVAKEIVKKATEEDRLETAYISNMGTLTPEEQQYFIDKMSIYKENQFTKQEVNTALDKLNGIDASESEIQEISSKLKDVSNETVNLIAALTPKGLEVVGQIVKSGLVRELENKKWTDREKYLKGVVNVLEKRNEQKKEEDKSTIQETEPEEEPVHNEEEER